MTLKAWPFLLDWCAYLCLKISFTCRLPVAQNIVKRLTLTRKYCCSFNVHVLTVLLKRIDWREGILDIIMITPPDPTSTISSLLRLDDSHKNFPEFRLRNCDYYPHSILLGTRRYITSAFSCRQVLYTKRSVENNYAQLYDYFFEYVDHKQHIRHERKEGSVYHYTIKKSKHTFMLIRTKKLAFKIIEATEKGISEIELPIIPEKHDSFNLMIMQIMYILDRYACNYNENHMIEIEGFNIDKLQECLEKKKMHFSYSSLCLFGENCSRFTADLLMVGINNSEFSSTNNCKFLQMPTNTHYLAKDMRSFTKIDSSDKNLKLVDKEPP